MYYVGIDISKYKHDCCIIDEHQNVFSRFSFDNNQSGFIKLESVIDSVSDPNSEMRIGFEATSHYALNLKLFLEKTQHSFMEFNPLLLSKYRNCTTLRRTKTDSVDCLEIARWLITADYKPYPIGFYHMYSLKSLTRRRRTLVQIRSRYSISITNVLDAMFPEFKPFFGNEFSPTALYILENYPSAEKIGGMTSASYNRIKAAVRTRMNAVKFAELKQLAKNTVGQGNEYLEYELLLFLRLYRQMVSEIDQLDNIIKDHVINLDSHLMTMPGIGLVTAAIILGECGDIRNFDSADKLLAFSGLEPGIYQSGLSSQNGKMVKHGSAYLRYAIINCTLPLIKCNAVFASYYYKKIREGKPHRVALTHVAKKLLRVIYTLETKGIDFDENLLR